MKRADIEGTGVAGSVESESVEGRVPKSMAICPIDSPPSWPSSGLGGGTLPVGGSALVGDCRVGDVTGGPET